MLRPCDTGFDQIVTWLVAALLGRRTTLPWRGTGRGAVGSRAGQVAGDKPVSACRAAVAGELIQQRRRGIGVGNGIAIRYPSFEAVFQRIGKADPDRGWTRVGSVRITVTSSAGVGHQLVRGPLSTSSIALGRRVWRGFHQSSIATSPSL